MGGFVSSLSSGMRRLASLVSGEAPGRRRWTGQPVPPERPGGDRLRKSATLKPDSVIVSDESMPAEPGRDESR